jgi:hypothetical protein
MDGQIAGYKTVDGIAREWGLTGRRVLIYLDDGRVPGAAGKGRGRLVPSSAQKPEALRKYDRRRPKREDAARDKRNGSARAYDKPPGEV